MRSIPTEYKLFQNRFNPDLGVNQTRLCSLLAKCFCIGYPNLGYPLNKNPDFSSKIKSSLSSRYYAKRDTTGGAHLRGLAPGQRNSEKTSQRRRAVDHIVSDLTGPGIDPTPPTPRAVFSTTTPTGLTFYNQL